MYSSETNPNGVWTQIVAATPRPEVEEIAKIIGKKLIDANEDLWRELCALKEIVADFLIFEFGNMKLLNSADRTPEKKTDARCRGPSHKKSRGLCSEDETGSISTGVDDFMNVIKDHLTVSKIHDVVNVVQEAFMKERVELEAEIALMQTTMDTESEVISRGNTPRGDKSGDSFGHHSILSTSSDEHVSVPSPAAGSLSKGFNHEVSRKLAESSASSSVHKSSVVIIGPGRIRRSDSSGIADRRFTSNKTCGSNPPRSSEGSGRQQSYGDEPSDLSQSLNLKLNELTLSSSQSANMLPQADGSLSLTRPSPSSSRSSSGTGSSRNRVRSRIETARDERFFMDEDIFMK